MQNFTRSNVREMSKEIAEVLQRYGFKNVEIQDQNASSLLWWMRRVISLRKKFKAFGRGEIVLLSPQNHRVLAFIRRFEDEIILVVLNLSRFSQCVEIDLSAWALPPVFRWLSEAGGIETGEMLRTFNAGVGMVLVVAADRAAAIEAVLTDAGERVFRIGHVTEGQGVRYTGALA